MTRVSRIRALAHLRISPIPPARAFHTIPGRQSASSYKPPKVEHRKATVVLDDPPPRDARGSDSPIYDTIMREIVAQPEKRETVLDRLEYADEDAREAQQKRRRLQAEAEHSDQLRKASLLPLKLPPPKTWADTPEKVEDKDPEYLPAGDYEALEKVGGLDRWFEQPGRWGAGMKPTSKGFWVASPRKTSETRFKMKGVVVDAVLGATEAMQGKQASDRIAALQKKKKGNAWMQTVQLKDLLLKFEISKRILKESGKAIPDAKLNAIHTLDELVTFFVTPPPPKTVFQALVRQRGRGRWDRFKVAPVSVAAKPITAGKPQELFGGKPLAPEGAPSLMKLPNVRVLPRRLTPVRMEREIGRWKEIEHQWRKRGLPADKTLKGVQGAREKAWAFGKV